MDNTLCFASRLHTLSSDRCIPLTLTHSALVLLHDYSKAFAARVAVFLRSSAGCGPGDVIIPAFGTVDAVHGLVWNRSCHL